MIPYTGGPNARHIKGPSYNPERARELIIQVRDINNKFKCSGEYEGLEYAAEIFEELGDKIDLEDQKLFS